MKIRVRGSPNRIQERKKVQRQLHTEVDHNIILEVVVGTTRKVNETWGMRNYKDGSLMNQIAARPSRQYRKSNTIPSRKSWITPNTYIYKRPKVTRSTWCQVRTTTKHLNTLSTSQNLNILGFGRGIRVPPKAFGPIEAFRGLRKVLVGDEVQVGPSTSVVAGLLPGQ